MKKMLLVACAAILISFGAHSVVLPSLLDGDSRLNLSAGANYDFEKGANFIIYGDMPMANKWFPATVRAGWINNEITVGLDTKVDVIDAFSLGVYSAASVAIEKINKVNLFLKPYWAYSFITDQFYWSVWNGVDLLEAINNKWVIYAGVRAFYRPMHPLYAQLEVSNKDISVSLGLNFN